MSWSERKQLIFILFAFVLSMLATATINAVGAVAALPKSAAILVGITTITLLLVVPAIMGWLWLVIEKKGKKENKEAKEERKTEIEAAVDKAMQKHTDAIVTALQKNSEAIIGAVREPLDGHE